MNAIAICSCPRLGFMDFMGTSLVAFAQNGITYKNVFGAFWSQAMSNGLSDAVKDGYEYVITTDYDSVFDKETVAQLIRLAEQNPHADAICAMQMGRFSGLLVSNETGKLYRKDLKENCLVPVSTGHFGLTLFRTSALKDLVKPWFWSTPDEDKEWKSKSFKVDEDIYFWNNFKNSGKQLYLAPRLVIGHLELMIKWPDDNLTEIYEKSNDYHQYGPPSDVWK